MARSRNSGYAGDVTHDGKRYRTSGWLTESAAEAWEHQAKANLILGKPVPTGPSEAAAPEWTLGEMLDFTYREWWSTKAHPSTFRQLILRIKKDLGPDLPAIEAATPHALAQLAAISEARGNSGATINRKLYAVTRAIKFCLQRGKLQGATVPLVERHTPGGGRERILTREEEAQCHAWLSRVDPDVADWFLLAIDTGGRSYSELLNVYPHIDVRGDMLHIRGRLVDAPNVVEIVTRETKRRTKTGRSRVVGLTSRCIAMIHRRVAAGPIGRNEKLFPERVSKLLVLDRWHRMADALGITDPQFIPYSLRHTFGTRMVLLGEPLPSLATIMGHSTINMTMKYVHLSGLVQTGAVSRLEKFLGEPHGGDRDGDREVSFASLPAPLKGLKG